jgi:hypothetical protein
MDYSYALHMCAWGVLVFYFSSVAITIKTMYNVNTICDKERCFRHNPYIRHINYFFILIIAQAITYAGLQIDWIIHDRGSSVGQFNDLMWLIHDYITGLLILAIALVVDSLANLKIKDYK